jgi:hypothetical protein
MSKYIPPHLKTQTKKTQSTEEKEPRKRHYPEPPKVEEFPELTTTVKPGISFASIIKKVEEKPLVKVNVLKPGWVYIKRSTPTAPTKAKSIIEFREGPLVENTSYILSEEYDDKVTTNNIFNDRINRMQEEQDKYNTILGDLSPYWGQPEILEVFYRDYAMDENKSDESDNDSFYSDTSEHYDALEYSD